jgi:hypothetical protein
MAKMYTFDSKKSNWTETIIPPIKITEGQADEFDDYCEEYLMATTLHYWVMTVNLLPLQVYAGALQ